MPNYEKRCDNCKFYEPTGSTCRWRPIQLTRTGNNPKWDWPPVAAADWCGQLSPIELIEQPERKTPAGYGQ